MSGDVAAGPKKLKHSSATASSWNLVHVPLSHPRDPSPGLSPRATATVGNSLGAVAGVPPRTHSSLPPEMRMTSFQWDNSATEVATLAGEDDGRPVLLQRWKLFLVVWFWVFAVIILLAYTLNPVLVRNEVPTGVISLINTLITVSIVVFVMTPLTMRLLGENVIFRFCNCGCRNETLGNVFC